MARLKKYTPGKLEKKVEKYFSSISRTVTATERYDTGERDSEGHKIFGERPKLNDAGEEIRYIEYVIPPTISSLCEFLGIDRRTWSNYCDSETCPEFFPTTTRVRGRIRAWLEQQLLSRKDVKGIIFDLQNNHGYSERQELDLSGAASLRIETGGSIDRGGV